MIFANRGVTLGVGLGLIVIPSHLLTYGDEPEGAGRALSAARKYALNQSVGVRARLFMTIKRRLSGAVMVTLAFAVLATLQVPAVEVAAAVLTRGDSRGCRRVGRSG